MSASLCLEITRQRSRLVRGHNFGRCKPVFKISSPTDSRPWNVECCNAGALQSTQLVGESSPSLSASTTGLQPTRLLASSTGPSWAKSAVHEDAMLLTVTISATAITVAVVCLVAWLMRRRNCRGPTSDQPSSARRHAPGDRRFSHSGARTGGAWEGYAPATLEISPPQTRRT